MTRDSNHPDPEASSAPIPDPIDVEGENPPAPGARAGWWAVFALVLLVALIVTVVIALTG